jgi:hypothetical protein
VTDAPYVAHYFVDEAGDLALFDKRGRSLLGSEGTSRAFMLGAGELLEPAVVTRALSVLRAELVADRYFTRIPSMHPDRRKTALSFHAKDDAPEVRREVYRVIAASTVKMFVCVRRKARLVEECATLRTRTGRNRTEAEIYDELVMEVFKNRLHLADANHIVFARRGQSTRNVALGEAIRRAKAGFNERWRKALDRPTTVSSSVPSETPCLQVVDYCLWALQRMIERREDRYFEYVADKFRLVLDRDDTRRAGFGEYYTSRNPLNLEKLMPVL